MNRLEYREKIRQFAMWKKEDEGVYLWLGYHNELHEMTGAYKKFIRKDYSFEVLKEKLIGELGDTCFYLEAIADSEYVPKYVRNKNMFWRPAGITQLENIFLDKTSPQLLYWAEYYYLVGVAYHCGVSMDTIRQKNYDKLLDRLQRGKIQGDGDNR